VAANQEASGRGGLVVVNDWIHGASSLTKTSTTAVQTFLSPQRGLIGTVAYGDAEFYRGPVGRNTLDSEFSLDGVSALPRVDIVEAYENMDGTLINAAAAAGDKGIVIAGVGNGNMTQSALAALAEQSKKGIVCVRSSRVVTGRVGRSVEVDDDKLGLIASEDLSPHKARVLLRLVLPKQRSPSLSGRGSALISGAETRIKHRHQLPWAGPHDRKSLSFVTVAHRNLRNIL